MPSVIIMNKVFYVRDRSNCRASREDAWGAKLQGTVRGHGNYCKYDANKPLFSTCERISPTIFPCLALALKVFRQSCSMPEKYKEYRFERAPNYLFVLGTKLIAYLEHPHVSDRTSLCEVGTHA